MTRLARSHDTIMLAHARRIAAVTMTTLALGAPAIVQAQAASPAPPKTAAKDNAVAETAFKRADTNGDGKLSKAEATSVPAIAAKFDDLDKDKDGMLSLAEFAVGFSAG